MKYIVTIVFMIMILQNSICLSAKEHEKSFYDILEISRTATHREITIAYRRLSLKYHPDKNPSDEAGKRMQEINEAHDVLSDPEQRFWYDWHYCQEELCASCSCFPFFEFLKRYYWE